MINSYYLIKQKHLENMTKEFLTAEDFDGKINLSGFTNIEKGMTMKDFQKKYPSEAYLVFEKSSIEAYIKKVNDTVGGTIVKGGFNDTQEANDLVLKAKETMSQMAKVKVADGLGSFKHVYVLEKSHVTDAFSYGTNAFKFSKSGKDIIMKVMDEKNRIEKENMGIEKQISECQEHFTTMPTEKPYLYGVKERVKVPYKLFNWNQTYYSNQTGEGKATICGESGSDCQPCNSQEEADTNAKYNRLVHDWIDNCAEILTLELYENHIQENKTYELTPDQMLALKF
jgi:hypothetical protein